MRRLIFGVICVRVSTDNDYQKLQHIFHVSYVCFRWMKQHFFYNLPIIY